MHLLPPQLSIHGVIIPNQNHWKIHEQLEVASRITAGSKKGQLWDSPQLCNWAFKTMKDGKRLHKFSGWPAPLPVLMGKKFPSYQTELTLFHAYCFLPSHCICCEEPAPTGREGGCGLFSQLSFSQLTSPVPSTSLHSWKCLGPWTLLSLWPFTELAPIYPCLSSTEVVQNSTCSLTDVDQRR